MTTTIDQSPELSADGAVTTLIRCPSWCSHLKTGYDHDILTEDGRRVAMHQGPNWGEYVYVNLVSDATTGSTVRIEICTSDLDDKVLTPGQLRALAADMLAAAEWSEEHRPDPFDGVPCPTWCTLRPSHSSDGRGDQGAMRNHAGPTFGEHVSTYADETERDGVTPPFVCLTAGEDSMVDLSPEDCAELGINLTKASAWVKANQ